jgi:hypothetical protein
VTYSSARRAAAVAILLFAACFASSGMQTAPARADTLPAPAVQRFPFAVKVLTENDDGLGSMTYADMAKLVYMMFASGAPAGSYRLAAAAGMKTVWYQDPHRIGDIPGHMSDRPPVTALDKNTDLMKCARGGILDSTYAPSYGTYFGDPTSPNLLRETNAQLAQAAEHYGPINYLWLDDSMLLTDTWAEAWYCGNAPPVLAGNGGNGMPRLGHGTLRPEQLAFANGSPYTESTFLAALRSFNDAVKAPVLDEGACIGDGRSVGGNENDGGATVALTVASANSAGAICENFAEGWGNRQTLDGKAVDQFWERDLNSGIRVISARKFFVNYQYIGEDGANRGKPRDADQRGYIYASFMLLFNFDYSVYKTGEIGPRRRHAAPVLVHPENLLVAQGPQATAVWPNRIDRLKKGDVYVREFAACGYAGRAIGPCAAVVNPSSVRSATIPQLQLRYGHQIAFVGDNGAFTGRRGAPNYGDTGDIDFSAGPVPGSLPPAGWAILVR